MTCAVERDSDHADDPHDGGFTNPSHSAGRRFTAGADDPSEGIRTLASQEKAMRRRIAAAVIVAAGLATAGIAYAEG